MKVRQFEFNLFGVNTFVVWDEKSREAIVVDPGMSDDAERRRLDDYIAENNLTVKAIVLTHMHVDHVLGVDYLRNRYGAKVYANRHDAPLGEALPAQAAMFHLPYAVKAVKADENLGDGESVAVGDHRLEVRQVPGHSPGSIILYSPDGGFAITGDTIFQGSIGRTDLFGGNHDQLVNAIHAAIMSLPPDTQLLSGHGPKTTVAREAASNPFI